MITGGTGDLGAIVVPRLLRDYRCGVLYRSEASLQRLQSAAGESEHLTPLASLDQVATLAPIYGVVHLAGGFAMGSTPDDYRRMFETNVMPAVEAIHAALPHMTEGGRIVAISSAASMAKPSGMSAYTASKAALNSIVETLSKELKDRRITANALLPTALDTPSQKPSSTRLVKRENVAEMIVLLLSEQGSNISGQLIGMSA